MLLEVLFVCPKLPYQSVFKGIPLENPFLRHSYSSDCLSRLTTLGVCRLGAQKLPKDTPSGG